MLVYQLEDFQNKIVELDLESRLEGLTAAVEELRTPADLRHVLDLLLPYYRAQVGRNHLIGVLRRLAQGDLVFCFATVLQHPSDEYRAFINNAREFGQRRLEPVVNREQEAIERWAAAKRADDHVAVRLPRIQEGYGQWLAQMNSPLLDSDRIVVYESRLWVEESRTKVIQERLEALCRMVTEAADEQPGSNVLDDSGVELLGGPRASIAYVWLSRADSNQHVLYLVSPFVGQPDPEEVTDAVRACLPAGMNLTDLAGQAVAADVVARLSSRTYPAFLLADTDVWIDIERDKTANLALSSEEEELLTDVLGSDGEGLPVFINGRAGSGKSTMLVYLFADLCRRKFNENLPGTPLFLTYSSALLDAAREAVGRLVRRFGLDPEHVRELEEWFQPFQEFVRSNLPSDLAADFDPSKYVDFHHFRQAFSGEGPLPPNYTSSYSPELSWYVVRTMIKGYPGEYMHPDQYEDLVPRKERVLDPDTFRQVHSTAWEQWYMPACVEGGFWDDQDLVRAVATSHVALDDEYAAIFCDEAQDFTRREILFLLQLSVFGRYDLTNVHVPTLPFAFAGDPMQTINPSGFRVAALGSAFFEEVSAAIPSATEVARLKERTLTKNYRSAAPIVRTLNAIQLWRRTMFESSEAQPQEAWNVSEDREPRKYILDSNMSAADLTDRFRSVLLDTIIVLPCDSGGELDFVRADDTLSAVFDAERLGAAPPNVLSAESAKGLEFDRVILYRFGDVCPQRPDPTRTFPPDAFFEQFFYNKLYVAASRATRRLFVIDTLHGDKQLWGQLAAEQLATFLSESQQEEFWRDHVGPMATATQADEHDFTDTDPASAARELFTKGYGAEDPERMRRAAEYYRQLGEHERARQAEAWALRFQREWRKAGERFMEAGQWAQAWECLWKGRSWAELNEWYQSAPDVETDKKGTDRALVEQMAAPSPHPEDFTKIIGTRLEDARPGEISPLDASWREVAQKYVDALDGLSRRIEEEVASDDESPLIEPASRLEPDVVTLLRTAAVHLRSLASHQFQNVRVTAGRCLYLIGEYESSCREWEAASTGTDDVRPTKTRQYALAKFRTDGTPRGLKYLVDIGAWDAVTEVWEANETHRDADWLQHVAPALVRLGRVDEAARAYLDGTSLLDPPLRFLSEGMDSRQFVSPATVVVTVERLADAGRVEDAVRLMHRSRTLEVPAEELLRGIARITHAQLSREQPVTPTVRNEFDELLEQATSVPARDELLDPRWFAAALEVAGNFRNAAKFYEQFTDHVDPAIRRHSRIRWLTTKARHVDLLQGDGDVPAEVSARERSRLTRNQQAWQLEPTQDYPVRLDRLPPLPWIEQSTVEQVHQQGDFRVTVRPARQTIELLHEPTLVSIHVDFGAHEVRTTGEQPKHGAQGQPLSMSLPGGGRLTALFAADPRVDVETGGRVETYRLR